MLLFIASVAWAVEVEEVPNPRADDGWITDLAGVLEADAEARLDQRIDALHAELGVEVAVVTVDQVPGTPKQFATALFNHWHIGDREANNGLLVLLVTGQRRLEMETGYGLEPLLPDGWLGGMQTTHMVPHFKRGDYDAGLEAGVWQVDARLRLDPEEARAGTRGEIRVGGEPVDSDLPLVVVGAAGGALGLCFGGGWLAIRRRQRTCPTCRSYMPMLDEAADDAQLDDGQQAEEAIGSIDWQVHVCVTCSHTRTFEAGRWFSGYSRCPSCGYRTRSSTRTTIVSATTYGSGTGRVDERCAHCSYTSSRTYTIPRIQETTSSSSGGSFGGGGGGSSFGGGSSGGGGAGSSW